MLQFGPAHMPILTPEERIGTELAEKYRIDSILGVGGMATVFAGTHLWTGREVAIKLLHYDYAADEGVVDRFLREARTAATLKHPHVVDVLDMGKHTDNTVFLVLERLDGESLMQAIEKRGAIPPPRAGEILVPVMRALEYAHRKKVIHRDLKPDNIFISRDATGTMIPKLLDFGIAKVVEQKHKNSTRTGTLLGTPNYMSPEHCTGDPTLDAQTDVWAMGVVWYETLTGVVPFDGPSPPAILMSIMNGVHKPLRELAPSLPSALVEAIEGALVKDRAGRYRTMQAFLEEIIAAFGEITGRFKAPELLIPEALAPNIATARTEISLVPQAPEEALLLRAPTQMTVRDVKTDRIVQPEAMDAAAAPVAARVTPVRNTQTPVTWSRERADRGPMRTVAMVLAVAIVAGGVTIAALRSGRRTDAPGNATHGTATPGAHEIDDRLNAAASTPPVTPPSPASTLTPSTAPPPVVVAPLNSTPSAAAAVPLVGAPIPSPVSARAAGTSVARPTPALNHGPSSPASSGSATPAATTNVAVAAPRTPVPTPPTVAPLPAAPPATATPAATPPAAPTVAPDDNPAHTRPTADHPRPPPHAPTAPNPNAPLMNYEMK